MYEGVAEQLHQFIVASSTATVSSLAAVAVLPFTTFPNNIAANTTFHHHDDPTTTTILTNYPSSILLHHHHHHSLLSSSSLSSTQQQQQIREIDEDTISTKNNNLVMMDNNCSNWSNDEVLALLKIRSSLENWFHDFTNWDQVSRKMAEQGFKRSAEKCKEKYEEESRFFNLNTATHNNNKSKKMAEQGFKRSAEKCKEKYEEESRFFNLNTATHNNNKSKYMFLSELEELFHGDNDDHIIENKQIDDANKNDNVQNPTEEVIEEIQDQEQVVLVHEVAKKSQHSKKKYKKRKFEMMKCICESVVRNIMTQQEELCNKILEDMVKRDKENIAREEAWKKQEIDRFNKEVEIRANEQAIAYDRLASMNEFFKNFPKSQDSQIPSSTDPKFTILSQNPNNPGPSALVATDKSPDSCTDHNDPNHVPNSPNLKILNPQNDPSIKTPTSNSPPCQINQNPNIGSSNDQEDKDYSKRWPRDEVLALINLRSNFYTSNEEKEGSISNNNNNNNNNKGPLWEKISLGMIELGYKRNGKRCKEKWENINKYFRKTKDTNASKKRSLNSRTCPYFHQLSNLYKQGSTTTTP